MWQMWFLLHHEEALSASIGVHWRWAECHLANLPDALSREEHTAPPHYHHHGRSIPQAVVGTCPVLLSLDWSLPPSDRGNSDGQSWLTTSAMLLSSHLTELKTLICILKDSILFCFKNDLFWNLIYPNERLFHLQIFQRMLLFPALYKEKMNVLLHS